MFATKKELSETQKFFELPKTYFETHQAKFEKLKQLLENFLKRKDLSDLLPVINFLKEEVILMLILIFSCHQDFKLKCRFS